MDFQVDFFIFKAQLDNTLPSPHPQCAQHTDVLKTKNLTSFSLFLELLFLHVPVILDILVLCPEQCGICGFK